MTSHETQINGPHCKSNITPATNTSPIDADYQRTYSRKPREMIRELRATGEKHHLNNSRQEVDWSSIKSATRTSNRRLENCGQWCDHDGRQLWTGKEWPQRQQIKTRELTCLSMAADISLATLPLSAHFLASPPRCCITLHRNVLLSWEMPQRQRLLWSLSLFKMKSTS